MRNFSDSLPMALLCAREATMAWFAPIFREHSITEQQWRVLRVLMEARSTGLDISALARKCRILQPSMSRILRTLQTRDLVWRRTDEHDQRSVMIALTPLGKDTFGTIMPLVEERYEQLASQISQNDIEHLFRISDKIVGCLDDMSMNANMNNTPRYTKIMENSNQ